MPPKTNETTRYLCASAFLSGASFRETILKPFRETHRAAAPELGADMRLVAQVCKFADRRAILWSMGFALLLIPAAILTVASSPDEALGLYMVLAILAGILYFVKMSRERYSLIRPFLRQTFNSEEVTKKYASSFEPKSGTVPQADQNLVVYGGFLPFVGAGVDMGGWSFAVSTIKPIEEIHSHKPLVFTTSELYSAIEDGIDSLGIEEIHSEDFYFVRGTDIRDDREILANEYGHPSQVLRPEVASIYKDACDSRIRHYKWIRVEDWGGELIVSMFLRCTLRGNNLFVEMKRFLLTPVAQQYRTVDKVGSPTAATRVGWFIGSMIVGPFYVLYSALFLFGRINHAIANMFGTEERKVREEIRNNPLFNYGAEKSLRTAVSSNEFQHYFQKLDTDFYGKVLERQILDSIVGFLDKHHINTSEIKERQNTILNSGIIVQGGDVKAESLAVGVGAKAIKSGIAPFKKAAKGAEA